MQDTQTLSSIIEDAAAELRDRWANYRNEFHQGEPHDVIAEIADSSVPVYTYDLMQLAANNISLAVDEPELGPAFDGSPTPVNIIAANIYEAITEGLWDAWREIELDDDDGEDSAVVEL